MIVFPFFIWIFVGADPRVRPFPAMSTPFAHYALLRECPFYSPSGFGFEGVKGQDNEKGYSCYGNDSGTGGDVVGI